MVTITAEMFYLGIVVFLLSFAVLAVNTVYAKKSFYRLKRVEVAEQRVEARVAESGAAIGRLENWTASFWRSRSEDDFLSRLKAHVLKDEPPVVVIE